LPLILIFKIVDKHVLCLHIDAHAQITITHINAQEPTPTNVEIKFTRTLAEYPRSITG